MSTGKPKPYKKLTGKHILIVEDDALIGGVLTELVGRYAHASHIESGEQALQEIGRDPPDIILLDMNLRVMSGLEVARAVRQNEKTKSIPVLAMSGSLGQKRKCLEIGCNGFILKPFDMPDLLNALVALLPA